MSLQHPLVLEWTKLRADAHFRLEKEQILIAGKNFVKEARLSTLITSKEDSDIQADEKYLVTDGILKKITGLQNPDGYAAICKMPLPSDLSKKNFLVILDQIQDPGNLGALLRSALALNWEGVIITPNTVDLFNDKVLRAAKGAHFHLPYAKKSAEEIQKLPHTLFTADLHGQNIATVTFQGPRALILSNEAKGPSKWTQGCSEKITIPMNGHTESLGVAASGAILLYAMRPDE